MFFMKDNHGAKKMSDLDKKFQRKNVACTQTNKILLQYVPGRCLDVASILFSRYFRHKRLKAP